MIDENMIIDKESYPKLFEALRTMELDNGTINSFSPAREFYAHPLEVGHLVPIAERFFRSLSDRDLKTFCIGEDGERDGFLDREGSAEASMILQNFWDRDFWFHESERMGSCPCCGMRIHLEFVLPPIPIRSEDWRACFDGQEEGLAGSGATAQEAVAELMLSHAEQVLESSVRRKGDQSRKDTKA